LDELNHHIREGLKQNQTVGPVVAIHEVWKSDNLTQQENQDALQPGQQLRVDQRDAGLDLKQGDIVTIQSRDKEWITLEDGRSFSLKKPGLKLNVGRAEKIEVREGDRLLVGENDKKKGITNGDIVTVKGKDASGAIVAVDKNGKEVKLEKQHNKLSYGNAVTSHKSQGRTVDHVVVAAQRLDSKACYVASSRGRQSASLHTPDKEALAQGLPRAADRRAALDALSAAQTSLRTSQNPAQLTRVEAWEPGRRPAGKEMKPFKEKTRKGPAIVARHNANVKHISKDKIQTQKIVKEKQKQQLELQRKIKGRQGLSL
jgi:ATP-dependent exoDNAse (exonuclease V) alpha subunit